jgi:hypothetical protein
MPKITKEKKDESSDLLAKILIFQLFTMGVKQDRIARTVGKGKAWVNNLLKGIPKGGKSDGDQEKTKKRKK